MKNINFLILGDNNIANELGKKGTTSDIAIYDRKTSDSIFTWALPLTFPDKVQTLMQVVNLAEYAILNVTKIDRHLGEQIIALDSVQFRDGFIVHSHDIDEADLKSITRNTSVSNFKFVDDVAQLKNEISILEPKPNEVEVSVKATGICGSDGEFYIIYIIITCLYTTYVFRCV